MRKKIYAALCVIFGFVCVMSAGADESVPILAVGMIAVMSFLTSAFFGWLAYNCRPKIHKKKRSKKNA